MLANVRRCYECYTNMIAKLDEFFRYKVVLKNRTSLFYRFKAVLENRISLLNR
jgi:hypothetical protein